jgi:pimeloyl-ACP methyl ester carboxylesterase
MHQPGTTPSDPAQIVSALQAQATLHETPAGAGTMVWRRWGDGPPLVLLHGGDGAWTHWIRTIETFMGSHSVWAPDLPGFGDSALPPEPCDAPRYCAFIADGLKSLLPAGRDVGLVGFSFGGEVAGPVAALAPAHVRRLVIVGSNSLDVPLGDLSGLVRWWESDDPRAQTAAHRRNLEVLMIAEPARIDDLALYIHTVNAQRARFRMIRPLSESNMLLASLARIKAPVFGIWGERDNVVGPYLYERERVLKTHCPGSEFHVVADAGHWVMYEAADAFNAKLQQIIDR